MSGLLNLHAALLVGSDVQIKQFFCLMASIMGVPRAAMKWGGVVL
jgi:hypothetical protein